MADVSQKKANKRVRSSRPSISVSGKTYDRLRARYPSGSLAALVDDMIVTALDDPEIAARMAALSQGPDALS